MTMQDPAQEKQQRLAGLEARLRAQVPAEEADRLAGFLHQYFRRADAQDMRPRSDEELAGAVLSLYRFAQRRLPGQPAVRVYNPTQAAHGWDSTRTVVEIVNDDMPFLVDSAVMETNRQGYTLQWLVHPIYAVRRDAAGNVIELDVPAAQDERKRESLMHMEIAPLADVAACERLRDGLLQVLADVRLAVEDWPKMRERMQRVIDELERRPPPLPAEEIAETRAFLEWLLDNHYTFLGYRAHDLIEIEGQDALRAVPASGLGVLRSGASMRVSVTFATLPPAIRARARVKELLVLTKSSSRSTVHRPGRLDYVGIKRYDEHGEVCGEHRFLGLYTHVAYRDVPTRIPVLRRKVAQVFEQAALPSGSHAAKALEQILDDYPRDELFQIDPATLAQHAMVILGLGERQGLRLLLRTDAFERSVSCLIYAPREHYNTEVRRKWQAILLRAFGGEETEYAVHLSDSPLARVLITVRTRPGALPPVDVPALEAELADAARRWDERLRDALMQALGEAEAVKLHAAWGAAFPAGYREDHEPAAAVEDVQTIARVAGTGSPAMRLYRPAGAAANTLRFKLYTRDEAIKLSHSMPLLERMGLVVLEERPYRISLEQEEARLPAGAREEGAQAVAVSGGGASRLPRAPAPTVWIDDFACTLPFEVDVDAVRPLFEEAFAQVYAGAIENDDFNRLILAAQLSAREVTVLRAYAKYMRQIGFALTQAFIESTLATHPAIARKLVELYTLRFDPTVFDAAPAESKLQEIEAALEDVESLNEDRVLRLYVALITATLRTNYWRCNAAGKPRDFLSFKFDPSRVPELPAPRPAYEIFVYSPRFEGVHLRGGKAARGGLRWSDRPEDFRTEVLGLVKAQMVKNAIIVPAGAKGGFVVKRVAPQDREAYAEEGLACYRDFLRGMLDLTDNLVDGEVVPPPSVRRHDEDDPYLVVAADKGTARFSDHANEVAQEYRFWLGDAFASGGSAGYDHKAMGITARGAWESAKRHFRELGIDVQTTPITVAGIGDMSGDVFGNGMLRSRAIKLVAAFDHRHVFIDPDPDPEKSFAERERLYRLPRSSWADYDAQLISPGGGVWPRTAKRIALPAAAARVLGFEDAVELAPNELVSAVLRAPVDLLYNGGIGTYVKAADESHAEVGDRANDPVRVDGAGLRARVVVEGGNLGFTQRGRIEYALRGGRINTDAIDNSAGVDASDHEVNIKILLGIAVADGTLNAAQRDALLAAMTDEVAALCLRDNYFQNHALSLMEREAPRLLDAHERLMLALEKSGRLDRAIEHLPDAETIAARRAAGQGLVRPELAVLLAYAKMWLYDEVLASSLPDDPWVATALARYFPTPLRETHAAALSRHPLRREIIATHVVNSMVNRVGCSFVHQQMDATRRNAQDVVRAYLLARESFDLVDLWQSIEALDNQVPAALQMEMLEQPNRLLARATAWFLRSTHLAEPVGAVVERFADGIEALREQLPELLDAAAVERLDALVARYVDGGAPETLARRAGSYARLYAALDIIEVGHAMQRPPQLVARVLFALAAETGLDELAAQLDALPDDNVWRIRAKHALRDDLAALQHQLATHALEASEADDAEAIIGAWRQAAEYDMARIQQLLADVRTAPTELSVVSVALRELQRLV